LFCALLVVCRCISYLYFFIFFIYLFFPHQKSSIPFVFASLTHFTLTEFNTDDTVLVESVVQSVVEESRSENRKNKPQRNSSDNDNDGQNMKRVKMSGNLPPSPSKMEVETSAGPSSKKTVAESKHEERESGVEREVVKSKKQRKKESKKKKRRGGGGSNNFHGFDMSKYALRHVALKVAYLGTKYNGFVTQDCTTETVEEYLFRALEKTCLIKSRTQCNYSRCGRTDAGVHAFGQVVGCFVRSNLREGPGIVPDDLRAAAEGSDMEEFIKVSASYREKEEQDGTYRERSADGSERKDGAPAELPKWRDDNPELEEVNYPLLLNRVLPDDIQVIAWCPVPLSFSARFSCLNRVYKYFFYRDSLDIEAMRTAASDLIGEHDYRNFCKMDVVNVSHFRRRIDHVAIHPARSVLCMPRGLSPENDEAQPKGDNSADGAVPDSEAGRDQFYEVTIQGSAFLWHQIRCTLSVLFEVGAGREDVSIVRQLLDLDAFPRKPNYPMADPMPLVLYHCSFDHLYWRYQPDNAQRIFTDMHTQWRKSVMHVSVWVVVFYV